MSNTTTTQTATTGFNMRGLLVSIVINAAIPFLLYTLSKKYISSSEVVALSIAALFPIADSVIGIVRHRQLDLIAVITLLGIVTGLIGVLLGGDPKILLIRESFLTCALGIACFVSLLLPKPLMFYFGRQMMAGRDPVKRAQFDAQYQHPYARFVHRLITIVWGVAYVGEFILRVVLVYTLPTAVVLLVSPFLIGGITVATILWTIGYVRYATKRGREMLQRQQAMESAGIATTGTQA